MMKKLLIAGLISCCALGFSVPLEAQAEDVWIYSGKGANVYVDTSTIYAKSSTEFNVIVKFNSGSDNSPGSTDIYHFFVWNGTWMFNRNPDTIATGQAVDSDFLAKKVFSACV